MTAAERRNEESAARRLTALHEAGHAVAAEILVQRAAHPITILPTEENLGSAHAGAFPFLPDWLDAATREAVAGREAQVLLAGLAAAEAIGGLEGAFEVEMDLLGGLTDTDPGHDVTKAHAWLELAGIAREDDRWHRLWKLYVKTMRLVTRPRVRAAVELVAKRLVKVGTIDGGEADQDVLEEVYRLTRTARRWYRAEHQRLAQLSPAARMARKRGR